MKKLVLYLLVFPLFFVACSDDEGTENTQQQLTYLTIAMNRDRMINIAQSTSGDTPFGYVTTLNVSSPEIATYNSSIQTLEVLELKFKVTDFVGDANGIINGYIKIDGTTVYTFVNQNVKQLNDNATEIVISDTQTLNNVAVKLKQGQDINIDFTGTSNNPNDVMNFNLKTLTKLKIGV